ncbi:MAG TPA: efflux RND transporter periplasmic adaptor subunit [Pseudomonadales bacterium]
MNLRARRALLYAAIGVGIVLALVFAWRDPAVLVESATAERAPFRVVVEAEGRSRARDRYRVTAPVSGHLARVEVEPGDRVERGSPLFTIHSAPAPPLDVRTDRLLRAALERSKVALQAAQMEQEAADARAEYAAGERSRIERLFESGQASREAVDRARADARATAATARSAAFRADVARHEMLLIEAALEPAGDVGDSLIRVESPVSGVVLRRDRESAGPVQAGEAVLELADLESLEVEVDVLSADAVRLEIGTPVEITRWGGPGTLHGTVRRIDPGGFTDVSALGVEEQRVWVIVALSDPASRRRNLGDGYRVEARFVLRDDPDVLQVPSSALFRESAGWATFVIEGGRAVRRPVEVGARSGLAAEILGGLAAGERVVLHPGDEIADGTRVDVR